MEDKDIINYINLTYTECFIQQAEDDLLSILKWRSEQFPTEKNDKEWLDFTDFVCKRRYHS